MVKNKITLKKIFLYLVFIAFLFPKGFIEINSKVKNYYSIYIWSMTILIVFQSILHIFNKQKGLKIYKGRLIIITYFLLAVIITLFTRKKVDTGLQQLLVYPSIIIFIWINGRKHYGEVVRVISNVFAILFFLNLIVTPICFKNVHHIIFLGHIQVVSQMGVLAIFTCVLDYMMNNQNKYKLWFNLCVIGLSMMTADADSAIVALLIVTTAGITYKWKLYGLFNASTKLYVVFFFILSILIIYSSTSTNIFKSLFTNFNFSGRTFVWKSAYSLFAYKPYLGYGIDGVLIKTFWSKWTDGGMNYAHNQIMQNLIDGGIVLLFAFWAMILQCASYINNIVVKKFKILSSAALITYLTIMIFDSVSFYSYMYIFIALICLLTTKINNEINIIRNE